jgi:MFS family permease
MPCISLAFIGTIISWFYISKWGRRDIWLYGFYMLVAVLFTIGILACVPNQTLGIAWAQSCLCLVWLGAYSMSVGPIVYTIVAEIGSTRMRTQTVVLGRSTYYVGNIIGGVLQPYFMSPTSWNAKGKTVRDQIPAASCSSAPDTDISCDRLSSGALSLSSPPSGGSSVFPRLRIVHTTSLMSCSRERFPPESSLTTKSTAMKSILGKESLTEYWFGTKSNSVVKGLHNC